MNTDYIQHLFTILECGSLNKAALKLNIPPHRLGRILSNIELEFNKTFFNRTKHGVSLTEDGKYFLEKMQIIYQVLEETRDHFSVGPNYNRNIKDTIYFYAPFSANNNYFSMCWENFHYEYPGIDVIYRESNNVTSLLEKINENTSTLGILPLVSANNHDYLKNYPHVKIAPLFREAPILLISESSKLLEISSEGVSLASLVKMPLVTVCSDSTYENYISESAFEAFNYSPSKIITASCLLTYYSTINRGDCIGIYTYDSSDDILLKEFPAIKKVSIKDNFFFVYHLAINDSTDIPAAVSLFHSFLFENRRNYSLWTKNTRHLNFAGFENPNLTS